MVKKKTPEFLKPPIIAEPLVEEAPE